MTITPMDTIMDKDTKYWNTHKKVYDEMLLELDNDVVRKVFENPNGAESQLLNKKVEEKTRKLLLQPRN